MKKVCAVCEQLFDVKPCHAPLRRTCSRKCMATDYRARLVGAANPHFKNFRPTCCPVCGEQVRIRGVYCSRACLAESKRKPNARKCVVCESITATSLSKYCADCKPKAAPKPAKEPRQEQAPKTCNYCAAKFFSYNKSRKFCSYPCFVQSGGPKRAGMEASKMTRKYGAKKDANHNDIARIFSENGVPFYDLSAFGRGLPDGIAWAGEQWRFVEIKNPKTGYGRRGLNPLQLKWLSQARGGPIYVIKTTEDAEKFAAGRFDEVPKEFPDVPAIN